MHKAEIAERVNRTLHDPIRLRDEIAHMEARLADIGDDGDCAYERAMIRFFTEQLAERRARLGVA